MHWNCRVNRNILSWPVNDATSTYDKISTESYLDDWKKNIFTSLWDAWTCLTSTFESLASSESYQALNVAFDSKYHFSH